MANLALGPVLRPVAAQPAAPVPNPEADRVKKDATTGIAAWVGAGFIGALKWVQMIPKDHVSLALFAAGGLAFYGANKLLPIMSHGYQKLKKDWSNRNVTVNGLLGGGAVATIAGYAATCLACEPTTVVMTAVGAGLATMLFPGATEEAVPAPAANAAPGANPAFAQMFLQGFNAAIGNGVNHQAAVQVPVDPNQAFAQGFMHGHQAGRGNRAANPRRAVPVAAQANRQPVDLPNFFQDTSVRFNIAMPNGLGIRPFNAVSVLDAYNTLKNEDANKAPQHQNWDSELTILHNDGSRIQIPFPEYCLIKILLAKFSAHAGASQQLMAMDDRDLPEYAQLNHLFDNLDLPDILLTVKANLIAEAAAPPAQPAGRRHFAGGHQHHQPQFRRAPRYAPADFGAGGFNADGFGAGFQVPHGQGAHYNPFRA